MLWLASGSIPPGAWFSARTWSKRAGPSSRGTPFEDLPQYRRPRTPAQAYPVLPFDLAGGVHQAMGEFPVRGEQQQARGVHVQPADRDPAPGIGHRQALEHRRAGPAGRSWWSLPRPACNKGVVRGWQLFLGELKLAAIQPDVIRGGGPVTQLRHAAADGHATRPYPFLDRATRGQARPRQELLQSDHAIITIRSVDRLRQTFPVPPQQE